MTTVIERPRAKTKDRVPIPPIAPGEPTLADQKVDRVVIRPPNFRRARFTIQGNAPYVQNRFSSRHSTQIRKTQAEGSTAKSKKNRQPKDFETLAIEARHQSTEGWYGIPAGGIRAACISACRVVGFHMTKAKLSVFVEADGFGVEDGTPLVRITKGEPHYCEHAVRNDSGVLDLRPRSMWDPGWEAQITLQWDADQFTLEDVSNLLQRVGLQVGIGEGRADSRNSTGMGWGSFSLTGRIEVLYKPS